MYNQKQSKNIACKQGCSRKHSGQTQQQIWKRKSAYDMSRKGIRISGYENQLSTTRKSKIHYVQIH